MSSAPFKGIIRAKRQEEAYSNPRHGKLGRQQFLKIDLKGMPSQEEHKTVVRCLMISNMSLTDQSDLKVVGNQN